jgi:hypothetical protein
VRSPVHQGVRPGRENGKAASSLAGRTMVPKKERRAPARRPRTARSVNKPAAQCWRRCSGPPIATTLG